MATILVVDDELGIRGLLSEILSDEGHTVDLAENAAEARAARERLKPDLVLLDIWMPDVDGISLLKEWGAAGLLNMPVIMMSGHGTIDTAVEGHQVRCQRLPRKAHHPAEAAARAVEQALVRPAPRLVPAPLPTAGVAQPGAGALRTEPLPGGTEHAAAGRARGAAGPATRTELRPRPPAARGPGRVREELFRVPPGQGERVDDPRGREDRAGTHTTCIASSSNWASTWRAASGRGCDTQAREPFTAWRPGFQVIVLGSAW